MTIPRGPSPRGSSPTRLSKSKFLSGLQCLKRLYLEIHSPELATERDQQTQAILDMGTSVGELARGCFPGGVLVEADHRHLAEALRRTAELMQDPNVPAIFEGAFEFERVVIRVDVLERMPPAPDGPPSWRLTEVKASTRVKDVHLDDLALQAYVLAGAGVTVAAACLMLINTQYVYQGGGLDLRALFAVKDLSTHVETRNVGVPIRLATQKEMLLLPLQPNIEPGGHCHRPYDCPFWEHCTKDKSPRWIYYLPGGDRAVQPFIKQGIHTVDDIPAGYPLNTVQRRMRDNVEWVGPGLRAALEAVRYPVHHLDFETFMPAIPKLAGTRPYQTIPTQWSNHIQAQDGAVRHDDFLCMEAKDPREELAVALLDSLGQEGSICVYSGYERSILEGLAEALPGLRRELRHLVSRLWDLLPVIRDSYYHPAFNGSYSIKAVLPALVPGLGYGELEIQEGGAAAQLYDRMVFHEGDWVEKIRIREALLKYCERDTLAMVEIRKALRQRASAGRS